MTEELWSPKIFSSVLKELNARIPGHGTTAKIETFNSGGHNVRTLSVVIVMLLHNAEDGKEPTLDTLRTYDLNANFRYSPDFDPYVDYLRDFDLARERKNKKRDLNSPDELLARAKCATTIIKGAFIVQAEDVNVDTLTEMAV